MTNEQLKQAQYIAAYIQEELDRAGVGFNVSPWLICDAMQAYEGGAADSEEEQTT